VETQGATEKLPAFAEFPGTLIPRIVQNLDILEDYAAVLS